MHASRWSTACGRTAACALCWPPASLHPPWWGAPPMLGGPPPLLPITGLQAGTRLYALLLSARQSCSGQRSREGAWAAGGLRLCRSCCNARCSLPGGRVATEQTGVATEQAASACRDAECENGCAHSAPAPGQRRRRGGPRRLRGRAPPSRAPRGAQGGLAGLLLRLRQDGHGELCAMGPPGLAAAVHGLRHFVTWRHPAASLSECGDHFARPVLYEVRPFQPYSAIVKAVPHIVCGAAVWCPVLHQGRPPIGAAA
jgi:hypothetical protein